MNLCVGLVMTKRFLAGLAATFLILFSTSLLAQDDLSAQDQENALEMSRIQNVLTVINSEIKSDLDQVLALQEAIKSNSRMPFLNGAEQGIAPAPVNIEDVAAAQQKAIDRGKSLESRVDALLARIAELGVKKQQLLDRFLELSQEPLAPVAKASK
jgi:hypothetical protein